MRKAIYDAKDMLQAMVDKPPAEFVNVTCACEDDQFQALAAKYPKSKPPDALNHLRQSKNAEHNFKKVQCGERWPGYEMTKAMRLLMLIILEIVWHSDINFKYRNGSLSPQV